MSVDRETVLQTAQKYVDKQKYDRAVQEYRKLVQADPNDARTLLKIGDLESLMQAYPEAVATYDRVGQFYAAKGHSLKAIFVYKQILELIREHAPELTDRYGHIVPKLAEIYTELGLTGDATAAYDELGTRLQNAGRDRDAVDVFRKVVELDATNPLPHLRLAEACGRAHFVDEAIDSFRTAADMLMKMDRPNDALKVFDRILHFRRDPNIARVAADLHLGQGGRENGMLALAKLQIAFEENPKDLDTLGLLARAFACIGQKQKALQVCKEMAQHARDQGRTDLHAEVLQRLKTAAPDVEILDEDIEVLDEDVEVLDDIEIIPDPTPSTPTNIFSQPDSTSSLQAPRPPMGSEPDVLILDDDVEITEEPALPDSVDASAHARKAIQDVESFRKLRLFSKAIKTLHLALEQEPQSLTIRYKLREVLVEAGERESALQETFNIAAIHVSRSEEHVAEPLLYEVLEAAPEHEDALQLLDEITSDEETVTRRVSIPDGDRQLPPYDMERVGAGQKASSHGGDSHASLSGA